MCDSLAETREFLVLARKMFKNEKLLLLTESNVLDVYKKLANNEDIPQDELAEVQKRFFELLNY